MKYRQPHTLLLIILLAALFPAKAQQIAWSVDMTGFFDNREFGYSKAQSQTFFGTRLSPEIGIRIGHSTITPRSITVTTPPNSECRWVCFPVPN